MKKLAGAGTAARRAGALSYVVPSDYHASNGLWLHQREKTHFHM
jgi:hypothetical protein